MKRGAVPNGKASLTAGQSTGWSDVASHGNASTTAIMADDEEAIEHPKGDCGHREEVHGGDSFSMIAQKGQPAFCRFRISWCFAHPAGSGSLGDIKAEHEKLTMNPRRSPGRILSDHPEDQILNLFRNPLSTDPATEPRNEAPIELESSSLPLNNGLRRDNRQGQLPGGPNPPHGDPKQFVDEMKSWSGLPTLEHRKLLSQDKIFH